MKPTPLDIRHQEFRRAMRGYSEEQVDVFLDEVADEFERLLQDNNELQERIQLLDEKLTGYEDLKETLNNTLVSAQQQADLTRANANKEGELILRDAELKARGIVGEAYSDKQRIQQSLIQLRQIEVDFRFKFRSLLEAHINLLREDEVLEERRRFRDSGTEVERDLVRSLSESPPDDEHASSEAAEQSSDEAPEVVQAPPESAEQSSDEAPEVAPAPPETAVVSDWEAVVVDGDAIEAVVDDDEIDLSGYLARLPDPGDVPDESAGEVSADEKSGDQARGSTVRRFLFGKRDKPESEELFERKDRDFEW